MANTSVEFLCTIFGNDRFMSKQTSYLQNFREKSKYFMFGQYLEKDEKILHVARRHPFILAKSFLKISILNFFLPIFLWFVFPEIWFVWLILVIYGGISLNKVLFDWYFDVILVTDLSLVDLKWHGFFDRESLRLEYANVEGTTFVFKGFWQTVFNYGLLQINRQGGGVGLELPDAINPSKVESIVMSYQEQYLSDKSVEDVKSLKNLLGEMIKRHAQEMKDIEVDF